MIVATDGPAASRLLGLPTVASKPVTGVWFAAPTPPVDHRLIMLDGTGQGPALNVAGDVERRARVRPGRALIVAACPGNLDPAIEPAGAAQMRSWFGPQVDQWEHLRTDAIAHGQPEQLPPFDPKQRVSLGEHRFVCGDHRDTASIQGRSTPADAAPRLCSHRSPTEHSWHRLRRMHSWHRPATDAALMASAPPPMQHSWHRLRHRCCAMARGGTADDDADASIVGYGAFLLLSSAAVSSRSNGATTSRSCTSWSPTLPTSARSTAMSATRSTSPSARSFAPSALDRPDRTGERLELLDPHGGLRTGRPASRRPHRASGRKLARSAGSTGRST
ncbi:MAG: hypothetical protein R2710_17910 [Acidimicrobiales bacterium]